MTGALLGRSVGEWLGLAIVEGYIVAGIVLGLIFGRKPCEVEEDS